MKKIPDDKLAEIDSRIKSVLSHVNFDSVFSYGNMTEICRLWLSINYLSQGNENYFHLDDGLINFKNKMKISVMKCPDNLSPTIVGLRYSYKSPDNNTCMVYAFMSATIDLNDKVIVTTKDKLKFMNRIKIYTHENRCANILNMFNKDVS